MFSVSTGGKKGKPLAILEGKIAAFCSGGSPSGWRMGIKFLKYFSHFTMVVAFMIFLNKIS